MSEDCDHHVGLIGSMSVRASAWDAAAAAFARVVQHFSDHTGRVALPHPGYAGTNNFCGDCGEPITAARWRWPTDAVACSREEYMTWVDGGPLPGVECPGRVARR